MPDVDPSHEFPSAGGPTRRSTNECGCDSRFSVPDVDAAVEWAKANASIPEEITAYGKPLGQPGHRIITADHELVVIDEWGDEEQFHKFFDSAPKMGEFLAGAGITSHPTVSVFDSQNVPGTF
jgi:hypothetical protein